jgi:hypothetical protein
VSANFDGTDVHFIFGIPLGVDGLPGEVTAADLTNAIQSAVAGTSSSSNAVPTMGTVISDPPTQAEVQQIVQKLDELIQALRG